MSIPVKNLIISEKAKISEVMKKINSIGYRCLFITNNNFELLGSISDGDIRRALLLGAKLNDKILKYYNQKPKYIINDDKDHNNKINTFKNKNYLNIIPVLNSKKKIIKFINLEKKNNIKKIAIHTKKFPLVIMAGGKGKRFEPISHIIPKPLIPLNGKSLVEIIINNYEKNGGKKIFISLGHKYNIIISYLQNLNFISKIKYIKENIPLGTIGSLKKIYKYIKESKNIIVTNCDTIITYDYNKFCDFHLKQKNDITVVVCHKNYQSPYGACIIDNKYNLLKINEKPKFNIIAHTGFYILNTNTISLMKQNNPIDFNEFIQTCIYKNLKIGVYPISNDHWLDVGDLNKLNDFNLLRNVRI